MVFNPVQINLSIKKRDSDWVQVCPNCQHERIVTYSQSWNIKKGNSSKECRSCLISSGKYKIKTEHLKNLPGKQEKARLARVGIKRPKSKDVIKYRQLFNNESLSNPKMKLNQRKAKLGKYGKLANAYIDGRDSVNKLERNRDECKVWRKQVFERDNYTCQICSSRKKTLNADHIKEWCNYPELRFELTNGRTLCIDCHKKTDNYGSKARKKIIDG